MNLDPIIRAIQEEMGVHVDGAAGPETWQALFTKVMGYPWEETQKGAPQTTSPGVSDDEAVDPRSETAIATLLPEVRRYARALLHAAALQGIKLVVTSATRTYAEQDALYAQGRSKGGAVVTHAKGGQSNHNFGVAFDVTIFDGTRPVYESPRYKAVGALGKSLGLTWGGDWISIEDEPHFELHPTWAQGLSEAQLLSALRERHTANRAVFA